MEYEDQGTSIEGTSMHCREQALHATSIAGNNRRREQTYQGKKTYQGTTESERKCTIQQESQAAHLVGIKNKEGQTRQENSTQGTIVQGCCVPYK